MKRGLLIQSEELTGPENMALDVILLKKALSSEGSSPILRLYEWKGNWLSIGKNQKNIPKSWKTLIDQRKLQIVRRPSGGSAVLHIGGLTYSLIWPQAPRKRHEAYLYASEWIIKGFQGLGLKIQFGNQPANSIGHNCFSTSTIADLIDSEGNKQIGSSQFWSHGGLLQHGEILIQPPENLWLEIFKTRPPKALLLNISLEKVKQALIKALKNNWPEILWEVYPLTKKDLIEVKQLAPTYSITLDDAASSIIREEIIVSTI